VTCWRTRVSRPVVPSRVGAEIAQRASRVLYDYTGELDLRNWTNDDVDGDMTIRQWVACVGGISGDAVGLCLAQSGWAETNGEAEYFNLICWMRWQAMW
jgi:hypothetical protein